MAKSIQERQTAALSKSARLCDVRAVISDTRAAIDEARAEAAKQRAISLDLSIESDAARTARLFAADLDHDSARHSLAIVQLEEKERVLVENEAVAARVVEYDDCKIERDQLVADLRNRWPVIVAEMTSLFERIDLSDERLRAVNGNLPKGRASLDGAESSARGVPGNFMCNGISIGRFGKMKLPALTGMDLAWPRPSVSAVDLTLDMKRDRARAEEARERERTRWARYTISSHAGNPVPFSRRPESHLSARTYLQNGESIEWLDDAEAKRLRSIGVTVDRMADDEPVAAQRERSAA